MGQTLDDPDVETADRVLLVQRSKRGMWILACVLLLFLLVVPCCVVVVLFYRADAGCRAKEAAIAAQLHTDPEPVARELAPLGRVVHVHWVQRVYGGMCDFGPGTLRYEREGIAELEFADYFELTSEPADEGVVDPEPDPRLSPFLPADPDWRWISTLGLRFDAGEDSGQASYALDTVWHLVYFTSDVDYEPNEGQSLTPMRPQRPYKASMASKTSTRLRRRSDATAAGGAGSLNPYVQG